MTPEVFFITDEGGHRHYAADVARLRRMQPIRWLLAVAGVGGFIAANIWHTHYLGDNVLAYVAVYGSAGWLVWRLVRAGALIREFNRQWAYHQRDQHHAIASALKSDTIAAQQPHGYANNERGLE